MPRPPFPASPLSVWSVEDDAVQIVWGDLPPGEVRAKAADQSVRIEHLGGAGSLAIEGLPPSRKLQAIVQWNGDIAQGGPANSGSKVLEFRTLTPPPGERLTRIATVSDLHLGATNWGFLKTMNEDKLGLPSGLDPAVAEMPAAFRCASAAITEALAWGAVQLVIKGDSAHHRTEESFAQVDRLLDQFPDAPILMIPGNHDVDDRSDIPIPESFGQGRIPMVQSLNYRDLPGIRLIGCNTTILNTGPGVIQPHSAELLQLASETSGPVLLATHHHFQPKPFPTYWPLGIPAPESTDFLTALGRANPNTVVTSGHTHRNRIRRHGPVLLTQVASTRDWPGVWAGYTVYEGGISQVVRRIAAPGAIHWHEYSKDALVGIWRFWSNGPLSQRCLVQSWSASQA